ncbi:D-alanine--D-alanine ligase [Bienertia sinuspersici]
MHKLFCSVTNAYSEYSFRKALKQVMVHGGLGAVKWFKDIGPLDRWTRWRFEPSLHNDETTKNFLESFNSTIGVDRCNPVLTLLEGVRRIAMVRHATRQALAEQWPEEGICPNILMKLRAITKKSRMCIAYPSGRGVYEVHDGRARLSISITHRSCACGKWQISGIPCKHGVKANLYEGKQPADFVSEWFSVARYKEAYSGNIAPVPDLEHWPHHDACPKLIAPAMKRSIGRPSRNRRREEGELKKGKRSTIVTYSKCKALGHNAATCKGGPTTKEAAEAQGNVAQNTIKGKKSKRPREEVDLTEGYNFIESLIGGTVEQSNNNNSCNNKGKAKKRNQPPRKRAQHHINEAEMFEFMYQSQP